MIVIMIVIAKLPPFAQVTEFGMMIIGIFIATIFGWIFLDLTLASLISISALCISGGMAPATLMAGGFGSTIVSMSIVFLFIAAAVQQMDIGGIVIDYMMGAKISRGRPWVKFTLFVFAIFFVSILTQSNVACVMAIPFFYSLVERSGMQLKSPACHALFGGVALAVFTGDAALPFKGAPLMYFGILSGANISVDPGMYVLAFPFLCLILVIYTLVCRFILRVDVSCLKNLDNITDNKNTSLNTRQKYFLGLTGILMLCMIVPSLIPESFGIVYKAFTNLGVVGMPFLFMAIMVLIQVDDKPLLDIAALAKDFQWPVIIMLANFTPLANLLTSDAVGLKVTIANNIGPLVSGLSPLVLTIVVVGLSALATNFLNNGVVFMVVISALTLLAETLPINVVALSYLVGLAATLCYALPSGNMMMAYMFSFRDIIDAKKWMTMNAITIVILVVVSATLGYFYYNMVF